MPSRTKYFLIIFACGYAAVYGFDTPKMATGLISAAAMAFVELAFTLDEINAKLQKIINNQEKTKPHSDD